MEGLQAIRTRFAGLLRNANTHTYRHAMNRPTILPILVASAIAAANTAGHAIDLIPFGSSWDYLHPTSAADPAVTDANFDSTWFLPTPVFDTTYDGPEFGLKPSVFGPPFDSGSDFAPFGYGVVAYIDNALGGFATPLTEPVEGNRFTAYFRHDFTTLEDVEFLALEIALDDGAVIYLDGARVLDINFAVADTYDAVTVAIGSEDFAQFVLAGIGPLPAGDHTLAISVHQAGPTSSDLGFDLRLSDEGFAATPFGTSDLTGTQERVFLDGDTGGWVQAGERLFVLDGVDGGSITSEEVDLTGLTDVVFALDFIANEISGTSNFEATDRFFGEVRVTLSGGGVTTVPLASAPEDRNGDRALTGDEFGPGVALTEAILFERTLFAQIPDDAVGARVVIEASLDSNTERFIMGNARFTSGGGSGFGVVDFGTPEDIPFQLGPGGWVEEAPREFSLNAAADSVLVSAPVDLSAAPRAEVSLLLEVSETSTGSNFEPADVFRARVIALDAGGASSTVQLVSGGADTNGDNALAGEEFAPGVDASELVEASFALSAVLPEGTVSAQIVIDAFNDSTSETFRISRVQITPATASSDLVITGFTLTAGVAEVTWNSESGVTYDLQFANDLDDGEFGTVDTITAISGSSSALHDPGAAGTIRGFYRVVRRP